MTLKKPLVIVICSPDKFLIYENRDLIKTNKPLCEAYTQKTAEMIAYAIQLLGKDE